METLAQVPISRTLAPLFFFSLFRDLPSAALEEGGPWENNYAHHSIDMCVGVAPVVAVVVLFRSRLRHGSVTVARFGLVICVCG